MLLQCCSQYVSKLEKSTVVTGLEKISFHSNPRERQCQRKFKLTHNCTHLTGKHVMLKILQVSLQQYVNHELLDVQTGFRKSRGTRDQIANFRWIIEIAREFQKKYLLLLYWLCQSFDCVDHNNLWKILQEMGNTRWINLPSEKSWWSSRNNSWNWTWNNSQAPN